MVFTKRDRDILDLVFWWRALRRDHIQGQLFAGKASSRCRLRLALLHSHRYLDKLPNRPVNDFDVYFVSRHCTKGLRLLEDRWGKDEIRKRLGRVGKLEHTLAVNDVRLRFVLACAKAGYDISLWRDEIDLSQMAGEVGLVPDAYFQIRRTLGGDQKTAAFFLEVEQTTRSRAAIHHKFLRYADFYRSGHYEAMF